MRVARIARLGAIYDASAADRTFTQCVIGDSENEIGAAPNSMGGGKGTFGNKQWLRTHDWFPGILE